MKKIILLFCLFSIHMERVSASFALKEKLKNNYKSYTRPIIHSLTLILGAFSLTCLGVKWATGIFFYKEK